MDGEPHPKDDHVRRPHPETAPPTKEAEDEKSVGVKAEIDTRGRVRVTAETHVGPLGTEQPGTRSGPTRYGHLPGQGNADGAPVVVDPTGSPHGAAVPNTPGVAEDNRAALAFLRQALDHLHAAGNSEDVVRQITSVYGMANHLVWGPHEWEPGLRAEFEGWVPYEIASGVPEYQLAKETVVAAGETVYESARVWSAERGSHTPIAGNPELAAPLWNIGANLRQAITEAIEAVRTTNANGLDLLRQALTDLISTTDPEPVLRYAGTVCSMISHLLHGDAMDPALADEEQAWIDVQPTEAAATAVRDLLVPAAEEFFQQAHQMVEWYPFHSLMGWDAPVRELLSASQHARAAATP